MSSKRSYLDAVNEGRQRRSYTSLEQLNRSLESLERRLGRNREDTATPADESAHQPRRDRAPAAAPFPGQDGREQETPPYQALAHDIERVRREEDGIAAFGQIADELNGLREELRKQIASDLRRDMQTDACDDRMAGKPEPDVGFRANAVNSPRDSSGEQTFDLLRVEMEHMKGALDTLAREETVRSVDRRGDELARRFSDFERKMTSRAGSAADAEEVAALTRRIDQIGRAVGSLPEALPLRDLEDKLRTLAGALDKFIEHQDGRTSQLFGHIEERLDEISRAIASTAVGSAHGGDTDAFKRIELRITALAGQIEDITEAGSDQAVMEHLRVLAQRIEDLVSRNALPEEAIDRLARHVALIAEKVDQAPVTPNLVEVLSGIDQRFDTLSRMFERRQEDAREEGKLLLREVERRLDNLAERTGNSAIRNLEGRLDDISQRLDQSAGQLAGLDPELVRSLEAQVAGLSEHLARPSAPLPEFVDISPRLREIERSIAESRESVLEAARTAAETAARSLAARQPDVVSELTDDLKALEELSRRADERNSKTFEAIHDTLLKIVDRMEALEKDGVPEAKADPVPSPAPETKPQEDGGRRRSMFGGLTRAFGRKAAEADAAPDLSSSMLPADDDDGEAPEVEPETPGVSRLAKPSLESDPGARDLNTILKRVRSERSSIQAPYEGEAGKSDFIAAARRAAQAAAAEAEAQKRSAEPAGAVKSRRMGELLKSRRTHLLVGTAALVTALAALHFSGIGTQHTQVAALTAVAPVTQAEASRAAAPESVASETNGPAASALMAEAHVAAAEQGANEPTSTFAARQADEITDPAILATDDMMVAAIPPSAESDAAEALHKADAFQTDLGPDALREAVAAGDPLAMFEVAARHAEGRGAQADMAEAATWFERSAEAGYPPAQYRIGNMYEKGIGVQRDLTAARRWYEQAAESGNASAMHNLAVLYAMGVDGSADNEDAAKWFMKAAELGVKDSQFNLGILSAKGAGVQQSLEESYKWFSLVAKTGDRDAAGKRDEIAKALRPEQLERARAAAELWKPKALDATANTASVPAAWQTDMTAAAANGTTLSLKLVQQILNEAGYDAGAPDGVMGEKTKSAIARFQTDHGLEPSGTVDRHLMQALKTVN